MLDKVSEPDRLVPVCETCSATIRPFSTVMGTRVRRQLFLLRLTTISSPGRVASIKHVTELLIVVGGRLQDLSDVLRRQLVRLDTVW